MLYYPRLLIGKGEKESPVDFYCMNTDVIIVCLQIAAVILTLALTAFCSGAEAALFSLSRSRVLSFRNSSDPASRKIFLLMEEQHLTLIVLIFCKMFFVTLTVMLTGSLLERLRLSGFNAMVLSALTGIVLVMFCSEILPMTAAYSHAEKSSKSVARWVYYTSWGLRWLTRVVDRFCTRFRIQEKGKQEHEGLSPDEYVSYIDLCEKINTFSKAEARLLRETLLLRTKTVESVMQNRSGLCYVTTSDSPETVRQMIRERSQAYLPVSRQLRLDSADSILSARLFFALPPSARKDWVHSPCVLENTVFIPEKTTLEKALRTMEKARVYAALAADEYGAVSGVITREDIYSELTGRSVELNESEEWEVTRIRDNSWMFDGLSTLDFMCKTLSLRLDTERFEASTLNGVFCELSGTLPREGDEVSFEGITLTAHTVNGMRLTRVRVTLERMESDPDDPAAVSRMDNEEVPV